MQSLSIIFSHNVQICPISLSTAIQATAAVTCCDWDARHHLLKGLFAHLPQLCVLTRQWMGGWMTMQYDAFPRICLLQKTIGICAICAVTAVL